MTASRTRNFTFVTQPIGPQTQDNSKARFSIVDHGGKTVVFIATADNKADFDAVMAEI